MANPPVFIDNDVEQIVADLITYYETATGRTLQPAQIERLIINAFAYRESLVRAQIQSAAEQNLVQFADAPVLDELGKLLGVIRLAATPAECTLEFTLVNGHTGVTIPAGTRVASTDGKVTFETIEAKNVIAGVTTAEVEAQCTTTGEVGNGYAIGSISVLLDPQAFITSVENTDEPTGGSDQETDDELRDRIYLAPSQFTTAGSYGAYKFHAKSAHPSIIDVYVYSPRPGDVSILPLMADGSVTPQTVLDAVNLACSDETVRPLTDLVIVESPTRVNYTIVVNLTLYNSADGASVLAAVEDALEAFILEKRQSLGQDIVGSQIIGRCQIDGVYEVELQGFTDIVIADGEFAFCTSSTVSIIAYTNG